MTSDNKAALRRFSQGYTFKAILLGVLTLLLLIPFNMIRMIVRDRQSTARTAEIGIMEAWGAELVEAGPVVVIPGTRSEERRTRNLKDGETVEAVEVVESPFVLVVAPDTLVIDADFATEVRRRGIFSVPLFAGVLTLQGRFDLTTALASLAPGERPNLDQAEIVVALSSQKGIRRIVKADWAGADLFCRPGNQGHNLAASGGVYAALPPLAETGPAAFTVSIEIQGGKSLRVLPIGRDTRLTVASDWASPSFQGAFLPSSSELRPGGFSAVWDVSYLSRDIPLFWKEITTARTVDGPLFGVDFYRAIDTYALNTRTVKYAVLFLIIPFLTLFLLEVFSKRRIHPVPYLLSGIANAVFYLLLLSLSEQMPFFTAYVIAALAVTVLLTLYARSLLPAWRQAAYYGGVVSLSYVLLYAVLNAESYALLIGSVGAFLVTALVMFVTRKLDWYAGET